jgi:hypothetical protein
MKTSKSHIDGQMFILQPGEDVVELKRKIVEAARHGADFVDFVTIGRGTISVLITPNLPVRFEVVEESAEQFAEWEMNPPAIDGNTDDHFAIFDI